MIGDIRAIITGVTNPIFIGVGLVWIVYAGAVIYYTW